jgi:hypothetical protein
MAEIEQRIRRLVLPDPAPKRSMALSMVAEYLRRSARGSGPDRLVLLAGTGRDPDGDAGALGGDPDPAAPGVLAFVVAEVAPDPVLEPVLAE